MPYTIVNTLTSRKSLECTGTSCNTSIDANRSNCFGTWIMVRHLTILMERSNSNLPEKIRQVQARVLLFISEDKTHLALPLGERGTGATANSNTTYEGDTFTMKTVYSVILRA
ncbi:MAG: hypothetical protein U5L46_04925 [Agrobacterium sp.]|nr:hypothetical protein [Agrobacterium sp.]